MVKALDIEKIVDTLPTSREEAKKLGKKNYKSDKQCSNGHLPVRITRTGECFLCKREGTRLNAEKRRRRLGQKTKKITQPLKKGTKYKELTATGKLEWRVGRNGKKGTRKNPYHEVKCTCGHLFFVRDESWGITERCRKCADMFVGNKNKTHGISNSAVYSLFHAAKNRAKRAKIDFSIELEDIMLPAVCPVLGIKLDHTIGNSPDRKPRDNAPSLDRLDPKVGYTKDNVVIMSYKANILKNDGSSEEHFKIANFIEKNESL
jgi:hypothetical protein